VTRYAVQGEPHDRIPGELVAATFSRREVVPWLCPDCDGTVAETVVDHVASELSVVRTVLPFEAVHHADADRDGIPFYGPTYREMRGKSPGRRGQTPYGEERDREARRREAKMWTMREGGFVQADLSVALDVLAFDTVCRSCPLRLRITLPPR